jgi:septum site-determining protein MinC
MTADIEKAIELEGMVAALTVVRVLTRDLSLVACALDDKIARTPGLFQGVPLVIDFTALEDEDARDHAEPAARARELALASLLTVLRDKGLLPVGVRAKHPHRLEEAAGLGLGRFEAERPAGAKRAPARADKPPQERPAQSERRSQPPPEQQTALMLTQPLRAGQIVHAAGRDAIALAPVNAGAELIADGNVHVYAALRGRALAGARGDEQARIFCQKLEADLISIAGVYLSAEEIPADKRGKAVMVQLQSGELVITELVPR